MSDHGFGMRDVMNIDEVRRNLRRDLDQLRAPEGYLLRDPRDIELCSAATL